MKSPAGIGLKIWVTLLTFWIGIITLIMIIGAILNSHYSPYDPDAMFTQWSGDRLIIGQGHGVYFITHLRNLGNLSIAELPKPIVAASSGGVAIPSSDLAKLAWIFPPDMHESAFPSTASSVVQAPQPGTPVEALYLFLAHAKFKPK